ncbi:MAG TPA: trypsin-like peptidase domain-containing protein [Solirubrobacteraceae bacterium]|nr:trypsin-like peptidase domain-containing protein [Solirubrobacteraceae bacterium]
MNDHENPGQNPGSGRLWTEPREEDEHTRWLAPRAEVQPPPNFVHEAPEEPAPQRRLWPLVGLGVLLACVLFSVGILGAKVLLDDDSGSGGSLAALPAAPGGVAPDARSRAVREVYAKASPSVVFVRSREGSGVASGTGFVVDSDGTIVTNAHVVAGSSNVQVRFEDNGAGVDAEVLGTDASSDIAVLRVDPSDTGGVKPLTLADSDSVRVGDLAVAIGYPLGLDRTATAGIVSGLGRDIKAPNGFSIDKVIQTDAPINPGNSGGPLLDAAGRVIGINSQIATTGGGGGSVGIGFAVPSNTVRQVVPRLRTGASIKRAYVGIESGPSTVGQGALVSDVVPGGPAERGGVQIGDTITRVGGEEIRAPEDISAAIANRGPGDEVEIELRRAGGDRTVRVTLGTRPEQANAPSSAGP